MKKSILSVAYGLRGVVQWTMATHFQIVFGKEPYNGPA